jgi:hypothetical protein
LGVFGPIELDVTLLELKQPATCNNEEILQIRRLTRFRNGRKEESLMTKIDLLTGLSLQ